MLKMPEKTDHQFDSIIKGYKQISTLQQSLCTYDIKDYKKDSEKGRLLNSLLTEIEAIEFKTLKTLFEILVAFDSLCKKQGIALTRLDSIRLFKPYKTMEQVLNGRTTYPQSFSELGCETYNVFIQRPKQSKTSGEFSGLIAARHLVKFDEDVYDVL